MHGEIVNQVKMGFIIELLKQQVSIRKLMKRNLESEDIPENLKNQLPLFLVQFLAGSNIKLHLTYNKRLLVVESDKRVDALNENHLFERMGLTQIDSPDDLESFIKPNCIEILDKHLILNILREQQ